jgi:hypothetical protein
MKLNRKFVSTLLVVGALTLSAISSAVQAKKVVIYPWCFAENEKGTNVTAIEKVKETLRRAFENGAKFEVMPPAKGAVAWKALKYPRINETYEDPKNLPALPSIKKLVAVGKKAGAGYVCAGRVNWRVKTIWVALGPKTKAYATIDCRLVRVSTGKAEVNVHGLKVDSTRVEKWYETAGAVLVTWGVTLVSGGAKSPHMQRSGQLGVYKALAPWLNKHK